MTDELRKTGEILFWGSSVMVMGLFLLGTFFVASRDMGFVILGFSLYGLSMGCLVMVSIIASILGGGEE